MYKIILFHELNQEERSRIRNHLELCGFSDNGYEYEKRLGKKTAEGEDTDRLLIGLTENVVRISADFACFAEYARRDKL